MSRKTAANSRPVVLCDEDILALTGGGPDRELIVTTYFVKTAFTGASVNDTVTYTQIINTTNTPSTVSTLWRNQTTGLDLSTAPSAANLTLVGSQALTDAQLRATAVEISKTSQTTRDCVISSGQSLSAGVDLGVFRLVGISIPSTFEPTSITFQSSFDNVTWNNVFTSVGSEVSVVTAASRRIVLSPPDFYGIRYIRVRGGTAASPTSVVANRTIKLIAEA